MTYFCRREQHDRLKDDGFSLLELVVAVGILLILTSGGMFTYSKLMNGIRQDAVDIAARTVLTDAMAADMDFDDESVAKDAETAWNSEAREDPVAKGQITVKLVETKPSCFTVIATHENKKTEAVQTDGRGCVEQVVVPDTPYNPVPPMNGEEYL